MQRHARIPFAAARPAAFACAPLALLALSASSSAQVTFSIDYNGLTIATPATGSGVPITEGDILTPMSAAGVPGAPAYGPLPPPGIFRSGGFGPPGPGLGLMLHPGCIGHPPGLNCSIEVDALSYGFDNPVTPTRMPSGTYVFSVDECTPGLALPLAPSVFSEFPFGDASADVFKDLGLPPPPLPPGGPGGNTGIIDGNGLASGSGALYPGLGLVEPDAPFAVDGDDVDAFDIEGAPGMPGAIVMAYFSLDGFLPDPCGAVPGGSAAAHGFTSASVLVSPPGGPIAVYAPGPALGLDITGPHRDDLDALALFENGVPGYQPSPGPFGWLGAAGGADMLLFSVRRTSFVVGMPDSMFGIPIEPGDILMPPVAGGLSPFPGIFIAAEWLGIPTTRSGAANPGNLDALDTVRQAQAGTPYCMSGVTGFPCPCGNLGAIGHGCANSANPAGALLTASGIASVAADTVLLSGSSMPPFSPCLYFQGTTQPMIPFGDGVRCVAGSQIRLVVKFNNAAGASAFPVGADPALSVAGAIPIVGGTRFYQIWHRDAAAFCTASTFNLSNGMAIAWTP